MSQRAPGYGAFVIAPLVPSGRLWVNTPWTDGPYEQSDVTCTDWMCLTETLVDFLIDPNESDTLIYTELPGGYGHATVVMQWSTLVSGTGPWLFTSVSSEKKVALVSPISSLLADEMGMIQSINRIDGNNSGYFQSLDAESNPVGEPVAFTQYDDYLKTDHRLFQPTGIGDHVRTAAAGLRHSDHQAG